MSGKRVVVNGQEVEPQPKHKLWQLPGWNHKRVMDLLRQKQAEARAQKSTGAGE